MSIKIGVIGDVHLGANQWAGKQHPSLNVNTRLIDYAETLDITIDEMVAAGVSEIVFTGDIFEHRFPSIVQQKIFSQSLHRALSKGIERIHIVIGNHDQQRIHATTTISYLKELNLPNIRVYDDLSLQTIEWFGKPVANLILMPYRDRLWMEQETHADAVQAIKSELDALMSVRNNILPTILVGHMTIEGTFVDEAYKDLYGENQLTLPCSMFSGINVTLMGHIHKPGVISENPYIAYIGSMEKRGGFEDHDKLYAIIDLETANVEYYREPCRDMWDLTLDYASMVVGEQLMDRIKIDIAAYAKTHSLSSSIVRTTIRICAEDEQFLDARTIASHLRDVYGAHFCAEIKPEIITSRQSRDDRITEDISHVQALRMYLENSVDDEEMRKMLIDAGVDIIRAAGDKSASH
jgi:DNA repair exonuclease SbcCD nuclease subunit